MRTYEPDGTGHCKPCGRDVGKHDGGHRLDLDHLRGACRQCELPPEAAIHDVGRVLTCPSLALQQHHNDALRADLPDAVTADACEYKTNRPEVRNDSL